MRRVQLTLFTLAVLMAGGFVQATANEAESSTSVAAQAGESVVNAPEENLAASPDSLTEEQKKKIAATSEQYEFGTEVPRLMKLIINSVYKNKEVFLRELISNASDALSKLRHQLLVDSSLESDTSDLKISVRAYPDENLLVIQDTGIGMTKEQLRENLGTIAKSGTAEFLNRMDQKSGEDKNGGAESDVSNLIGQFGVGFYSAFLVADKVTFTSKTPGGDKQYVWASDGVGDFTIYEDLPENDIGHGSKITLHFKDDEAEYLEEQRLKTLIEKHSKFTSFPIYLWSKTSETIEVPVEDVDQEEKETAEEKEDENKAEVEDDTEDTEDKPKTTTQTIEKEEWTQVNSRQPIWMRDPKDVSEDEYKEFYQDFTKEVSDPLTYNHFKAEGTMDFRGLIFIPAKQPNNYIQSFQSTVNSVKLFVKRVFITDELGEFLPRYLNFVKVLIDADDLPLNVSRETLQNSRELNSIKKTLVRKILDTLGRLAIKDPKKYKNFLEQFGANLRMGITEDNPNRSKIARLLRFDSSASKHPTSFEEYVSRMKKGQKSIYYIAANSLAEAKASPYVEALLARGYEVLFMTNQLDEYTMQALMQYNGKQLRNVAQSGFEFGDEDEADKTTLKDLEKDYEPLVKFLGDHLSERIEKAVVSNRLTTSPCAIAASNMGWSGTMERFMKAQDRGQNDFMTKYYLSQKKVFEINPYHPIMKDLLKRVADNKDDEKVKTTAEILLDTATLQSGYDLQDIPSFTGKIETFMRRMLDVDEQAKADVPIKPAPEVKGPEDDDDDADDHEDQVLDFDELVDKSDGQGEFDVEEEQESEDTDTASKHDEL